MKLCRLVPLPKEDFEQFLAFIQGPESTSGRWQTDDGQWQIIRNEAGRWRVSPRPIFSHTHPPEAAQAKMQVRAAFLASHGVAIEFPTRRAAVAALASALALAGKA